MSLKHTLKSLLTGPSTQAPNSNFNYGQSPEHYHQQQHPPQHQHYYVVQDGHGAPGSAPTTPTTWPYMSLQGPPVNCANKPVPATVAYAPPVQHSAHTSIAPQDYHPPPSYSLSDPSNQHQHQHQRQNSSGASLQQHCISSSEPQTPTQWSYTRTDSGVQHYGQPSGNQETQYPHTSPYLSSQTSSQLHTPVFYPHARHAQTFPLSQANVYQQTYAPSASYEVQQSQPPTNVSYSQQEAPSPGLNSYGQPYQQPLSDFSTPYHQTAHASPQPASQGQSPPFSPLHHSTSFPTSFTNSNQAIPQQHRYLPVGQAAHPVHATSQQWKSSMIPGSTPNLPSAHTSHPSSSNSEVSPQSLHARNRSASFPIQSTVSSGLSSISAGLKWTSLVSINAMPSEIFTRFLDGIFNFAADTSKSYGLTPDQLKRLFDLMGVPDNRNHAKRHAATAQEINHPDPQSFINNSIIRFYTVFGLTYVVDNNVPLLTHEGFTEYMINDVLLDPTRMHTCFNKLLASWGGYIVDPVSKKPFGATYIDRSAFPVAENEEYVRKDKASSQTLLAKETEEMNAYGYSDNNRNDNTAPIGGGLEYQHRNP